AGDQRVGAGARPRVVAVGRADRARRLVRGPPLAPPRPAHPGADRAHAGDRPRAVQGRDGRMAADRVAVLLTGVGKRYDIVSAFARHALVVAADPSPLAPAQYAADTHVAPPPVDDPGYVPFLERVVAEHGVKAVLPPTDLD